MELKEQIAQIAMRVNYCGNGFNICQQPEMENCGQCIYEAILKLIEDRMLTKDEVSDWMIQESKRHSGTVLGDAFERVFRHFLGHKSIKEGE